MIKALAFALVGTASAQCPGGKVGYSDSACAITQEDQMDADMLVIVQAVSDFKDAIGDADVGWTFAGAMGAPYTATLQVRPPPASCHQRMNLHDNTTAFYWLRAGHCRKFWRR